MKIIHPSHLLLSALLLMGSGAWADISTRLTDTIQQGTGSINLLKDITGAQLAQQVTASGKLFFGMDINENASGNELPTSIGVALQSVRLAVVTTTGTYHFTNVSTNSTALLSTTGTSGLSSYGTLFGHVGSSQLTSSTSSFDLSSFDDVMVLNNVSFTGDVLSAQMSVQLVNTGNSKASNDTFFDYSGGFEDMALLSAQDAFMLENANIGLPSPNSGITYTTLSPVVTSTDVAAATPPPTTPTTTTTETPTSTTTETPTTTPTTSLPTAPPAAPAPGLLVMLVLGLLVLAKKWSRFQNPQAQSHS